MDERIAVLDTETTWSNELMSLGVVIARGEDFAPVDRRYYVLLPQRDLGGMYTGALYINGLRPHLEGSRTAVTEDLGRFLAGHGVKKVFAYNARFDRGLLPELWRYRWYDIMRLAAYRQYNRAIPPWAECCQTGRLKRGFGVENVYRMLSGDREYFETHNALLDAWDELAIMGMLGLGLDVYERARL